MSDICIAPCRSYSPVPSWLRLTDLESDGHQATPYVRKSKAPKHGGRRANPRTAEILKLHALGYNYKAIAYAVGQKICSVGRVIRKARDEGEAR